MMMKHIRIYLAMALGLASLVVVGIAVPFLLTGRLQDEITFCPIDRSLEQMDLADETGERPGSVGEDLVLGSGQGEWYKEDGLIQDSLEMKSNNHDSVNQLENVKELDEYWLTREIEKSQDEIKQADLERGLAILEQLDTDYLYRLSEDGFTEEEKLQAEDFLRSELSEDDVQVVMVLVRKYIHLLQE